MQVLMNFVRTVLAVDALMKREDKEFTTKDLLHIYCIVRPRRNSETHMYKGFNARFWWRSNRCAAAIIAVNNYRRTHNVVELFGYVLSYYHTIPYRADRREQPRPPPLRIYVDLGGDVGNEEAEVEDGKEVNQVPAIATPAQILGVEPILVQSSNSKAVGDLDFPKVQLATREIIEHSFNQGDRLGFSSREEEEVTSTNTSKDHETCIALGNAIMLPQDVVDLAEDSKVFGGRLLMMGAQSLGLLGTPFDHPAWVTPTLPIELLDPTTAYPLILVPDFNEEEYATLPVEGEDGNAAVTQGNEPAEVEGIVAEEADSVEDEGEDHLEE
ncbi:hypothetical protein Acr_24g0008210 [Actinidia rufa]|uniref:Uncharacterized protein n=1 Tax=Actinidia rufa TaxID=165716 RepID=A0A7J0GV76_9ERIC|nr:hypothetical protein Acr_24g0008210 [Actinidia rufa]